MNPTSISSVANFGTGPDRVEVDADQPAESFQGTLIPREVIVLCVRWYLRYPLSYEHVAELVAERGIEVDPSCKYLYRALDSTHGQTRYRRSQTLPPQGN